MRPGFVRRMALVEAAWVDAERARLAALSPDELAALFGPETCAWLEAYLAAVDEAELDEIIVPPVWPYTGAQQRLLQAWHRGQAAGTS